MSVLLNPTFNEERHEYRDGEGVVYPSVTELIGRYWPIDRRFYQATGTKRGTDVHSLTEVMDRKFESANDAAAVAPQLGPYLAGWEAFKDEFTDGPDGFPWIEQRFIDTDRAFSGTVDRLMRTKSGEHWIVDIKTGKPEPWHELQQAAYASVALRVQELPLVDRIVTVQLIKGGRTNYRLIPHDLDRGRTAWDALVKWDRYRRAMKK